MLNQFYNSTHFSRLPSPTDLSSPGTAARNKEHRASKRSALKDVQAKLVFYSPVRILNCLILKRFWPGLDVQLLGGIRVGVLPIMHWSMLASPPGGVVGISSDGDDRMEPKVKTQKNP